MKTIYADVLIILNIYVNFFLLRATAKLTHTPLKTVRCVGASAVGSLFSLMIFLHDMNIVISWVIKLAAASLITLIAFGMGDWRRILKLVFYFYLVNFLFGGIIMLFYITFKPGFMAFSNTYFYIDFSLLSLVVFTAVAYFAVTLFRKLLDKNSASRKYEITISKNGESVCLSALCDTGNSLVDIFTGKPVIICRGRDLCGLIGCTAEPVPENAELLYRTAEVRFIPYSTIGNSGMIAVFTPDEVVIRDSETGRAKKADAAIGLNTKDVPAIFNPNLL